MDNVHTAEPHEKVEAVNILPEAVDSLRRERRHIATRRQHHILPEAEQPERKTEAAVAHRAENMPLAEVHKIRLNQAEVTTVGR
jgi:hypothetical protein